MAASSRGSRSRTTRPRSDVNRVRSCRTSRRPHRRERAARSHHATPRRADGVGSQGSRVVPVDGGPSTPSSASTSTAWAGPTRPTCPASLAGPSTRRPVGRAPTSSPSAWGPHRPDRRLRARHRPHRRVGVGLDAGAAPGDPVRRKRHRTPALRRDRRGRARLDRGRGRLQPRRGRIHPSNHARLRPVERPSRAVQCLPPARRFCRRRGEARSASPRSVAGRRCPFPLSAGSRSSTAVSRAATCARRRHCAFTSGARLAGPPC